MYPVVDSSVCGRCTTSSVSHHSPSHYACHCTATSHFVKV